MRVGPGARCGSAHGLAAVLGHPKPVSEELLARETDAHALLIQIHPVGAAVVVDRMFGVPQRAVQHHEQEVWEVGQEPAGLMVDVEALRACSSLR